MAKDIEKKDKNLEIFLIALQPITDCSYMFEECVLLEEFQLFKKKDENKVQKKKELDSDDLNKCEDFYLNSKYIGKEYYLTSILNNYSSISFLDDKTNSYDIYTYINSLPVNFPSSIINMSWMFCHCSSLISLRNIPELNTENVKNMSYMFYDCSSLSSLPDLSKWNTEKVENLSYMFGSCSSLSSLPDISKWNTKNVKNMAGMFRECSSLISLPDLSKWNTENVDDMGGIFCLIHVGL